MARNDVYLNINALSPADAVVTGQQDMTAATVPELVLGDTPTFNFYFTDNTNVWPSWAGNASYSLTWALSDAVAGDFSPAATTGNATPITGGWSVILPLNSYDLVGLLNTKRVGQPYPVTNLWQQLRVTDPSGNEITRAMFWTPVRYRAISDTQNTESASPTGGRFVTVNNVNTLTTPTAAQFYAANPVPTSALGTAANGELLIGNGTGFTKATLTAGTGVSITNGSGSITISATDGDITLDDGTAAAPSLKFTSDTDTGLYRPAANTLGVAVGGAQIAYFDANGITTVGAGATFDGSVHAANGNANNPSLSFTSDDNTGFFRHQPDEIGITLGGTQTGTLTSALATLTSKLLVSSGATTTAATDLLVNPAVKASGNLLDLQVASSSKFSVSSAGNGTLGGNLTVSGTTGTIGSNSGFTWDLGSGNNFIALSTGRPTITAAVASGNNAGAALSLLARGGGSRRTWNLETDTTEAGDCVLRQSTTEAGSTFTNALYFSAARNATLSGNLTVSGGQIALAASSSTPSVLITQTDSTQYSLFRLRNTGGTAQSYDFAVGGSGTGSLAQKFYIYDSTASAVRLAIAPTTGNFLLGTTTDSGNGKLQLATHTTSAGGIGFGTDTALYRGSAGELAIRGIGNEAKMTWNADGTIRAYAETSGTGFYLTSFTGAMYLRTNGYNTALTLDSSQNATFAGTVTANNVITATTANDYGLTGIRTSAATNATARAALIQHTTSGDMVDGQGAAVAFALRDSAAVTNIVGDITCVRAGADNTGDIVFRPYTTGTANERMRVRANGRINFASLPTSSAGLAAGDIWNDGGTLKIV